jgi:hypothetical protein
VRRWCGAGRHRSAAGGAPILPCLLSHVLIGFKRRLDLAVHCSFRLAKDPTKVKFKVILVAPAQGPMHPLFAQPVIDHVSFFRQAASTCVVMDRGQVPQQRVCRSMFLELFTAKFVLPRRGAGAARGKTCGREVGAQSDFSFPPDSGTGSRASSISGNSIGLADVPTRQSFDAVKLL